jgi:catechol 2,3-dioxygenase-like lactoylglutathione lyase family enzyme
LSEEGWSASPAIDAAIGSVASSCRGYMLAGHNCYLELFEFSAPEPAGPAPADLPPHARGLRHLCFFVDDLALEHARVLELGGQPLGSLQKAAGISAVYLRDPDGNIIELAEFPSEAEDLRRLPGISALQTEVGHV